MRPLYLRSLIVLLPFLPILGSAQPPSCKSTITGHVDIFTLTSRIFHNERSLRVWLPSGYEDAANAQKKYQVLYLLDGQAVFDKCSAPEHEEFWGR
jgi:enterochelin esterase-like enzyme